MLFANGRENKGISEADLIKDVRTETAGMAAIAMIMYELEL